MTTPKLESTHRAGPQQGNDAAVGTAPRRAPKRPKPRRVKTPTVLQLEAVECGAASLAMILAYYKRFVGLQELRFLCGVSRDGSKASHLVKAGRQLEMQASGKQMDLPGLAALQAPAIIFWQFNHYVVWEGNGTRFGKNVVYINDPAQGRRMLTEDEFSAGFTGIVLQFQPGPGFVTGGQRDSLIKDMLERFRGTFGSLAIALIASLLLAVASAVTPSFLRVFTDSFLIGGETSLLIPLFLSMLAVGVTAVTLVKLEQTYLLRVLLAAQTFGSARFVRHMLRLSIGFFSVRSAGDTGQRVYLHQKIAHTVSRQFTSIVSCGLLSAVYLVLLFSYDVVLATISVLITLVNVGLLRLGMRFRQQAVDKVSIDLSQFFGTSSSGIQSIETIKATGGEWGFFRRWGDRQASLLTHQQRAKVPAVLLAAVTPLLAMLNSALVLLIGGHHAIEGTVTIGLLVVFQVVLAGFNRPVSVLIETLPQLQEVGADVARLRDVELSAQDPVFERPDPDTAKRLGGRLSFNNVTFGYGRLAPPLLKDFSFDVGPGRQVALVGGSGAGKSTVTKLIAGHYERWSGDIILDGQAYEEWPRGILASSVCFVDQDVYLFEGTIKENVTLWDPAIPDEDVMAALRDACMDDVVAARIGGIHSKVEQDGRNFSGGQRQRLEIARALVRSPSILVLDEATSALDSETEYRISRNLRRRGCACIIIAHRMSTIRNSDEIIVLERGQVIQRGTHEELSTAVGRYAELIKEA
jgi:NHLM bacteriocin system ABC transporter peptidase/ATP-binding protein